MNYTVILSFGQANLTWNKQLNNGDIAVDIGTLQTMFRQLIYAGKAPLWLSQQQLKFASTLRLAQVIFT